MKAEAENKRIRDLLEAIAWLSSQKDLETDTEAFIRKLEGWRAEIEAKVRKDVENEVLEKQ